MATCGGCAAELAPTRSVCEVCGALASAVEAGVAARKYVSVLFVDLVDSTHLGELLDPEELQRWQIEYFRCVSSAVDEEGGSVEKYIGDAVMAVFGLPLALEDHAERAVRAGLTARDRVAQLNLRVPDESEVQIRARVGVNSGEVLVGRHDDGSFSVTGDVVNVAARLQQHAGEGEVVLGDLTATLVGECAVMSPLPTWTPKGKSAPVTQWRLDGWVDEPSVEAIPFVDRALEMADLDRQLAWVRSHGRACQITIIGVPGIGKSRLLERFVASCTDVRFLRGWVRAPGSLDTFAPLRDILHDLGGERWQESLALLLEGAPDSAAIVAALQSAVGESSQRGESADLAWACGRLFEEVASRRPVVLVWDDLHHASTTFLDLVEKVGRALSETPIFTICIARPELFVQRPAWGGGLSRCATIELDALPDDDCHRLVALLDDAVVAHGMEPLSSQRLVEASAGSPLVLQHLVRSRWNPQGDGRHVPPTIAALFAAQFDRLEERAQWVLARAAIVGSQFDRRTLEILVGAGGRAADIDAALASLRHSRVLSRVRRGDSGQETYRFTQELMREVAYSSTSKSLRAQWHLLLARRLAEAGAVDPVVLAGHVCAAAHLLHECGAPGDRVGATTTSAVSATIDAASSASRRGDIPGQIDLLRRGLQLPRLTNKDRQLLETLLVEALIDAYDIDSAQAMIDDAAARPGDLVDQERVAVQRASLRLLQDPTERDQAQDVATRVLRTVTGESPMERCVRFRAHELMAAVHVMDHRLSAAEATVETALREAAAVPDARRTHRLLGALTQLLFWGATPCPVARRRCQEAMVWFEGNRRLSAAALVTLGGLFALEGAVDTAGVLMGRASDQLDDLDDPAAHLTWLQVAGVAELALGHADRAGRHFLRGRDTCAELGLTGALPMFEVFGIRAAAESDRDFGTAADQLAVASSIAPADIQSQMMALSTSALGMAQRADWAGALSASDQAVQLAERSDDLRARGDTLADRARLLAWRGDTAGADRARERARSAYHAKGATWCADRLAARSSIGSDS